MPSASDHGREWGHDQTHVLRNKPLVSLTAAFVAGLVGAAVFLVALRITPPSPGRPG
jgi:hypothetical protein